MELLDTDHDVREVQATDFRCEVCGQTREVGQRADYKMQNTVYIECPGCGTRRWFHRVRGAATWLVEV